MTQTYATPEGFELYRPLLMPQARDFAEVLTYVKPWDHATMNHRNGVPGPERPAEVELAGNYFDGFCSVGGNLKGAHHMVVEPTQATIDALEGELLEIGDHMAFKVIYHVANERCLVLIDHNQIIGSRWLAYIDPATVPGVARG